jgi:hypothetical protein
MLTHPDLDRWVSLDRTGEAQKLGHRDRNAQTHRAAATTAATHDVHIGMTELPIAIGVAVSARATWASETNPKITPETTM